MPLVLPLPGASIGEGSADIAQPGTNTSLPLGVEAVYEYNGLYLNRKQTIDRYVITNVTGLDDADVRTGAEANPGYHGESGLGAYYGGRTIVFRGKIRAHTLAKLRDMQQALRMAFGNINDEKPLTIHGADLARTVIINCRKYQKLEMGDEQKDFNFYRDFMVTVRASDPRFYSFLQTVYETSFSDGPITNLVSFTAVNVGNFPTPPLLILTGSFSNLTLTNNANNTRMVINGQIPAGEIYELDCRKRTMRNRAGFNVFNQLDITSQWIEIDPGDNPIEIDATNSAGASVSMRLNHTWI